MKKIMLYSLIRKQFNHSHSPDILFARPQIALSLSDPSQKGHKKIEFLMENILNWGCNIDLKYSRGRANSTFLDGSNKVQFRVERKV